MKVTMEKKAQNVLMIKLNGRLDSGTAPELQKQIVELIADGEHRLMINLAELAYISSAGLRILITTAKQLKAKNGQLILCTLPKTIHNVLKISGFTEIFDIQETEEAALEAFS